MGDISIQWLGTGDECIIIRTTYRHKYWVGKKYPVVQGYRGSGTVWHNADTGGGWVRDWNQLYLMCGRKPSGSEMMSDRLIQVYAESVQALIDRLEDMKDVQSVTPKQLRVLLAQMEEMQAGFRVLAEAGEIEMISRN